MALSFALIKAIDCEIHSPGQNTQIFASKYKLYLPTEDELRLELQREYNALGAADSSD
jgi:hypothetical protein